MENIRLIISISESLTKNNKKYVIYVLSDGTNTEQAYAFNTTLEKQGFKASDIINAMLSKSGEFINIDLVLSTKVDKSKLPLSSPILAYFERDITVDDAMMTVKRCLEVCSPWVYEFLKSVKIKKILELYERFPAATKVHHARRGGLLIHVNEMMNVALCMRDSIICKKLDFNLILLGILFHDYGKIKEYDESTFGITKMMPLLGHIYISSSFLEAALREYNASLESSDKLSDLYIGKIIHVVLSHHKTLEWGSPVTPAFPEAYLVHAVDMLSGCFDQYANSGDMQRLPYLSTTRII